MHLSGKRALVTGADTTGGIGYDIARLLVEHGATVTIAGRNTSKGEQTATELGGETRFLDVELSDLDSVGSLVERAGEIDVLVNNAGTQVGSALTVEQEAAPFDQMFEVNVRGPYFLTAGIARGMVDRRQGSIINIASMIAHIGLAELSVYGATKAAVESLTRTWAAEFGSARVRVNAVAPGPTASASVLALGEGPVELAKTSPLGRLGTTTEIAEAVSFLAGDGSAYMTGATIAVDGGRTAV
jgi:NAD(P)-dependent dehydrogenase (short-subunit alcohol dehydrogenase family)